MSTTTSIALAALLGMVLSIPAAAQQEGMVVVRDPQTGKFRPPTAAELQALLAQQPAKSLAQAQPSPVTIRKNGTLQQHLGDRGMVYSVVSRAADGKLDMQCVEGEAAAAAALARPAAPTSKEHVHETR
jgi:hypothetical protein